MAPVWILVVLMSSSSLFSVVASMKTNGERNFCEAYPEPCENRPTSIPNGNVTHVKDFNSNIALQFFCQDGYVLRGKPFITCCNEIWEDIFPKCLPKDCKAYFDRGETADGAYTIYPDGKNPVPVHCDMSGQGGGWTVIQRRVDASENFYRKWVDYKKGFGNFNANYWFGLDNLHLLTEKESEVYFFMNASKTESAFARYSKFHVADESDKYKVTITGYSGTAGDCTVSGSRHSGMKFSTLDFDNDISGSSCAVLYKGGWWYDKCHSCNPNGLYLNGSHSGRQYGEGIEWNTYKGYYYSMIYMEIKIRRK